MVVRVVAERQPVSVVVVPASGDDPLDFSVVVARWECADV
jgi:hypothetical protein